MPVGGQAVIEGVMFQNGQRVALAVRTPEGRIVVEPLPGMERFGRWGKIPFVRGPLRLYEMLSLGLKALNRSAALAYGETGGSRWDFLLTVLLALALVVGGFVVLPVYLTGFFQIENNVLFNLAEGGIRIAFFLLYLWGISFMSDIRRVFQYHGAEHKTVHAYEAGEGYSLSAARRHSPLHPRCGTAFLLLFVVISILIFSLVVTDSLWLRVIGRIALLPVVAGVAYELLVFGGRHQGAWWMRPFLAPGLWLQRLTTREPADDQLDVALAALRYVTEGASAPSSSTTA